jgi:hypothetical protein
MTLIIEKPTGAKLNLKQQPVVQAEADINAYISLVELTDDANGQSGGLETGVKDALKAFAVGCASDGIWNAIKASCILAGAKTLQGALVPLVGVAPTNFNFAAGTYSGSNYTTGDYDRKTGLLGNGSTKYLNSNRNNNADPQDNRHVSVIATLPDLSNRNFVSSRNAGTSIGSTMIRQNDVHSCTNGLNAEDATGASKPTNALTFTGVSRSNSSNYTIRLAGANYSPSRTSGTPISASLGVFANITSTGSTDLFSNARIAFYSIGESLNLALLDARVTDLINAFAAAIP